MPASASNPHHYRGGTSGPRASHRVHLPGAPQDPRAGLAFPDWEPATARAPTNTRWTPGWLMGCLACAGAQRRGSCRACMRCPGGNAGLRTSRGARAGWGWSCCGARRSFAVAVDAVRPRMVRAGLDDDALVLPLYMAASAARISVCRSVLPMPAGVAAPRETASGSKPSLWGTGRVTSRARCSRRSPRCRGSMRAGAANSSPPRRPLRSRGVPPLLRGPERRYQRRRYLPQPVRNQVKFEIHSHDGRSCLKAAARRCLPVLS